MTDTHSSMSAHFGQYSQLRDRVPTRMTWKTSWVAVKPEPGLSHRQTRPGLTAGVECFRAAAL